MNDNNINNISELEFVVFCIENVAKRLNVPAEEVYTAFTDKSSILYDYIVSEYEMLHTQSMDYIVEDILDYMNELGVSI